MNSRGTNLRIMRVETAEVLTERRVVNREEWKRTLGDWQKSTAKALNPLSVTLNGNAAITATFVELPHAMLGTLMLASPGRLQFGADGSSGQTFVIERSTNLNTAVWVPVVTNTLPFIFTEESGLTNGQRLYRAIRP